MENPVQLARKNSGLTRGELAIAAGVSYSEVWKAESGYCVRLNNRLAEFLQRKGLIDNPQEEYRKWRSEQAMALMNCAA